MHTFWQMIFIFHCLALHVSEYQPSIIMDGWYSETCRAKQWKINIICKNLCILLVHLHIPGDLRFQNFKIYNFNDVINSNSSKLKLGCTSHFVLSLQIMHSARVATEFSGCTFLLWNFYSNFLWKAESDRWRPHSQSHNNLKPSCNQMTNISQAQLLFHTHTHTHTHRILQTVDTRYVVCDVWSLWSVGRIQND